MDEEDWLGLTKQIDKLPKGRRVYFRKKPPPIRSIAHSITIADQLPFVDEAAVDKRQVSLRRSKQTIDAKLDLHGLTQKQAYLALQKFIMLKSNAHCQLLLVITGKSGVLNQQLPLWLASQELSGYIGGYSLAKPSDGGEGAFYVRLKVLRN